MWTDAFLVGVSLVLQLFSTAASDPAEEWAAVDKAIDEFKFLPKAAFTAGDHTGRKHVYVKGGFAMDRRVLMASSSKFPAVLAIGGVIQDGHVSFDTLASEVFDWWTTNQSDTRSRVRLSHLLGFVSGLTSDDYGDAGFKCLGRPLMEPEWCAREIYTSGPWTDEPNTTWSYHSLHLQIATSMAAKAAKLSVHEMFRKHLLFKIGMNKSFWFGWPNTHVAGAMVSTGDDYEKLLLSVLNYQILPKSILEVMERDYLGNGVKCADNSKDKQLISTYGHYSMGLYFECVNQPWSETCFKSNIHADPGAFGYWPLIDRTKGYYMQIVTERHPKLLAGIKKKYNISAATIAALPALCTYPLRFDVGVHALTAMGFNLSGLPGRGAPNPMQFLCDHVTVDAESETDTGSTILV